MCVGENKGRPVGDMVACLSYHGNGNIGIMRACVRKALLLVCEFSQFMYATVLQITTVLCVSIHSSMISGWQYCVNRKRLNGEEELQGFISFLFMAVLQRSLLDGENRWMGEWIERL